MPSEALTAKGRQTRAAIELAARKLFFTSVVTGYWNMFKQNIGIMIAVAQLAATQQRFAAVQNQFRRFGIDIVAASVLRAQQQGYASDLNPEHIAAAIATLSTVWKKTLYGS